MVHRDAAIRAAWCAVVIPLAFFIAQSWLGGGQFSLFASFGGFAVLVFADFPGDRAARAASYAALAVASAVLIALGTLCATPDWLAVVTMLVVGVGVLFVGVLSAALAGATRAALLTFILPVTIPGGAADIPERLGGWLLALLICVPTALFLFPQPDGHRSRRAAAALCASLAKVLATFDHPGAAPSSSDAQLRPEAEHLLDQLRSQFRADVARPVGLNAGSRALVRVVDELEWLTPLVAHADAAEIADAGRTEPSIRVALNTTVHILETGSRVLDPSLALAVRDKNSADRSADSLSQTLDRFARERHDAFDVAVESIVDGTRVAPSFRPHEIAATTALVGHTIAWAAAADARPLFQRLVGTGLPPVDPELRLLGEVPALRESALSYITGRSVWLRNSIRGGIGLALAVLVAVSFDVSHGFWVVLGTLSVLRSSALSTSSTAVRAVAGTLVGFGIGASIILIVGTGHIALSIVLPFAVFVASYAPAAMSFAAGQAAFTLVVLILFNLIEPVGWKVGVTRIEDVALGCLISLGVGLLLWPRGASAAVASALAHARAMGADYFGQAVDVVTIGAPVPEAAAHGAVAAGRILDDAMRQLQVEIGQDRTGLIQMSKDAGAATRVRLAADAICSLGPEPDRTKGHLPATRAVLQRHADRIAAAMSAEPSESQLTGDIGAALASTLRAELDSTVEFDDSATRDELPRRLVWAAMYIKDVEQRLER